MIAHVYIALIDDEGSAMAQVTRSETVTAPWVNGAEDIDRFIDHIDMGLAQLHTLTSEALERHDAITREIAANARKIAAEAEAEARDDDE